MSEYDSHSVKCNPHEEILIRSTPDWVHSWSALSHMCCDNHLHVRGLPVPAGVQAQPQAVESADPGSNPLCITPQHCPSLGLSGLPYGYSGIILPIIISPMGLCRWLNAEQLWSFQFMVSVPKKIIQSQEQKWRLPWEEKPQGSPSKDTGGAGGRKKPLLQATSMKWRFPKQKGLPEWKWKWNSGLFLSLFASDPHTMHSDDCSRPSHPYLQPWALFLALDSDALCLLNSSWVPYRHSHSTGPIETPHTSPTLSGFLSKQRPKVISECFPFIESSSMF